MQTPQVDTAAPLWDRKFRCSVSRNLTTSDYYIETFGFVGTGNPEVDKGLKDEIIDTYVNINTLVGYFRDSIPFRLHRYDDTKIIYELIQAHLDAWKQRLDRAVNISDAPIDDLIALDQLASKVYDKAKYYMTPQEAGGAFSRFLSKHRGGFSKSAFKIPKSDAAPIGDVVIGKEENDGFPVRPSMEETFKSIGIGMRRWK
jgi:hypothetical protein